MGVIDFINQVPNARAALASGGQIDYAAADKDARAAWTKFQNFTGMMGDAVKKAEVAPILVTLASLREELTQLKSEWESVEIGSQAFTDLSESIRVAEENLDILVNGPLKITAETTDLAAKSINGLGYEMERTAGIIQKALPDMIPMLEDFTNKLDAARMVGQEFGDILAQAFMTSLDDGENFFDVLGKALKIYIIQLAVAIAAALALAAIMSAIPGAAAFGATLDSVTKGTQVGGWMDIAGKLRGKDLYISGSRTGTALNRSGGGG